MAHPSLGIPVRFVKSCALCVLRRIALFRIRSAGCVAGSRVLLNGTPHIRRKGTGRIVLGYGVTINSSLWGNWLNTPGATVLSVEDGALLELKPGSGVSGSHLIANLHIEIGEQSMIGAGCLICDSDMHEIPLGSGRPTRAAAIFIGRRVFVGARCIILKGVTIGDGAVIGTGSVVTRNIAPGVLAAGNPALVVRNL